MSSPARDERLLSIALGYTQVHRRGSNSISMRNPTTNKIRSVYGIGHGWHYGAGLETDTAWEADSDSNYLKMVKAGYNLRARKLFNAGDLVQYIDPVSGQYVKFQPVNFQWIDGTTGSNSLISVAQAISAPTIDDDDKLYWPAAFGAGRHFRYTAAPTRLVKHLIIDSAANLPACPAWITNPWLELTFTLTPSSGVTMYVDGAAWNQATAKTTANAIEFRLPSGEVVWSMAAPLAYDSSDMGEPCNGQIKLYVNKKIKYCSVRFPKAWIDTAVFPIVLDPTVDYQISAGGDDGHDVGGYSFDASSTTYTMGYFSMFGAYTTFLRFTGVTIPAGATIDSAKLQLYLYQGYSGCTVKIYADDQSNPSAPTTSSNLLGRTKTTNYASATCPTSGTWWDSPSLVSVIQELVDSYSYASGSAMQFIIVNNSASNSCSFFSYNYGSSYGAKLIIEYTAAAAGGTWAGTWGG